MACTDAVAPDALATLLGYWSHALLFRRAVFSVSQDAYGTARAPAVGLVLLRQSMRSELLLLACLVPLLSSDLRAPVCSTLVAKDADITRGAAVTAMVPLIIARRLFAGADFCGADA